MKTPRVRFDASPLSASMKLEVFRRAAEFLASSRTFEETMASTIAACLPAIGDFGFFDLVVGESVRRTARAHDDPRVEEILRPTEWVRQERTDINLCALSTGAAALHRQIDDSWYQSIAVNDGHLAVLRQLAFCSMVTVPMRYQGELLGALTLFHGRSGRQHDEDALAFAGDLAALAAPVVAHARLLAQQLASEAAVRASEERLRVGMDAGELGVWDWDTISNKVSWSDRVYRLHGVKPGEFGGRVEDFTAFIHPDDRDLVGAAIEGALTGKSFYQVEFRVVWPDGQVRWLSTRAEVHRDSHGAPVRMIGATHDVTERVELLANERAAREEIARAREAAESASRAKDEFLAMLGHELRNPLAPITTALQLMDVRDGDRSRRERDVIRRQVAHMIRLVDDLLDVSRIARGKIALVKAPVDLMTLVDQTLETVRGSLTDHHLVIERDLSGGAPVIMADPVRVMQIIGNLLANAAKFSPKTSRIVVRVVTTPAEVELFVQDEGVGITADLLPDVFGLFTQGPQPLAREQGGLGIGLAIVANLVSLHGGRVSAASEGPGRGATFRVCLPRAEQPVEVIASPLPVPTAPAKTRGSRVLLVDDNQDAAELLGEFLSNEGHDVRVVGDGHSALAIVDTFTPDVAILDIGLPGMDGYDLARRLRQLPLPRCRIIAVTGYGLQTDRDRARDAGFDGYLVKPVDLAELVQRIAAEPVPQ